jgi:hypothetical protein
MCALYLPYKCENTKQKQRLIVQSKQKYSLLEAYNVWNNFYMAIHFKWKKITIRSKKKERKFRSVER